MAIEDGVKAKDVAFKATRQYLVMGIRASPPVMGSALWNRAAVEETWCQLDARSC